MAVSIWEGSKAQNLIDAVEKGGLSEGVKNALLDIAQNVVYQNQNGSTYYNNLYNALYPAPEPPEPVDPTLLYYLQSPVTIQANDGAIDTGVPFSTDGTFTFLVDAMLDANPDVEQRRILSGMKKSIGINVMVYTYNNAKRICANINNTEFDNTYDASTAHRVRYSGLFDSSNKQYKAILYVDNNKVIDRTTTISTTGTSERNMTIGGFLIDGVTTHPILGTVNLCNIYNRILTSSEIQNLIGISV